jgi:uncharacterized membrane protein
MTNASNSIAHRALLVMMPAIFVLFLAALTARLIGIHPPEVAQHTEARTTFWLWLHLVTVVPSLPLGFYLLINSKGTPRHRLMGKIWCALMVITALAALMIRGYFLPNWHGINPIHIFSIVTLISVPRIIFYARNHRVREHKAAVYGLCMGGLFIAGLFAFLPGRLLGAWLFGG